MPSHEVIAGARLESAVCPLTVAARCRRGFAPRAVGRRPRSSTRAPLVILLALGLAGVRLQAQRYAWTNFAGSPGTPGTADGRGSAARFRNPVGIAVDDAGNVYVADSGNYTLRKVSAGGVVTTLAGSAGNPGRADGSGTAAQFRWPAGLAAGSGGLVYVTDTDLHTVRALSVGGVVTTLAGNTGNIGSADGAGSAARFNNPLGIALSDTGNIYVADIYSRTIRSVTAAGVVTTLAGLAGHIGSVDGTGSAARFYDPLGVAVDVADTVYVADSSNHTIRRVSAAGGVVTTLAGLAGSAGSADGLGTVARFNLPFGLAADREGNLFITDSRNYTVRRVTAAGQVTTIGGLAGYSGSTDGTGSAARFASPYGIAVDRGGNLYVADAENHRISRGRPLFPATVTGVAAPLADGLWGLGARLAIQVTFSKPVTVTGVPQLTLETGAADAAVNYASGSGTTTLTFLYTVAAGQASADLDYAGTNALALHGGTIRDSAGISATLALPVPGAAYSLGANQAIVIDGIAPTVTLTCAVSEPTNLAPIPFSAAFSQAVSGFDVADLTISNGTGVAFSGAGALYSFAVTPAAQGLVTVALAAGVCASAAGNPNLAAAPMSRTYDGLHPTVISVSSPTPDGIYGPGAVIVVNVAFSEAVTVNGTPRLALETGELAALANYSGGSGTATLTFAYPVSAGHTSADLDYAGTGALVPLEGSIQDAAGNDAVLTLPVPGAPHSLGANQALVVAAVGAPNGPFLARQDAAAVTAGRGIWDLTGSYVSRVDGNALALELVHDTRGKLSGRATLQLSSGGAGVPLALSVRGSVKGVAGTLRAAIALRGTDATGARRAVLTLALALDAAVRQLRGPLTGTLQVHGIATPVVETVTLALPAAMDGTWSLRFELLQEGRGGYGGSATLTLANGVHHQLAAQGRADGAAAMLNLTGRPADPPARAIHMRTAIDTLQGALTRLSIFSGKACGQTLMW